MQTFLPYSNFTLTSKVLDYRRLGKQRIETKQILMANLDMSSAWKNHPACKMWKPYPYYLALYGYIMCREWISRGYKDTQLIWFNDILQKVAAFDIKRPTWLGNEDFHKSHRSNLLRKNLNFYSQYGWTEPPDLPYIWPTEK